MYLNFKNRAMVGGIDPEMDASTGMRFKLTKRLESS
jgi:hypothetical protein